MIQKLKMTLLSMSAMFMFAVPLVATASVSAVNTDIENSLCKGADLDLSNPANAPGSDRCAGNNSGANLTNLIRSIINIISIIVGAVAVIMIIIGGFRYVTSGGNDTAVASAKNTILYAIIGLIIVALAQLIVRFVLKGVADSTT
jgi:hypothetical protein